MTTYFEKPDNPVDMGDLERRIKDAEARLSKLETKRTVSWMMILFSISIIVFVGGPITKVFGVIYLGINAWRLMRAGEDKAQIEEQLRAYQGQRAGVQPSAVPET